MQAFSDLATAAYCPRKLYYRWRDPDIGPPAEVAAVRELAFRYDELFDGDLSGEPIDVTPTQWRTTLACTRERLARWDDLTAPAGRAVFLEGKDARGIAHKVLTDPLAVSIVSPGAPPEEGVWKPQTVRAVAAAKALSWEQGAEVEEAYVEYPAHGVVRRVNTGTRGKAQYREALGVARSIDGPPARVSDARCEPCEYREQCGTRTRTFRSLLSR
ncbi:CRISPR-associated protein Cas4 [Natronomonas sp. EA1]|uniref:CRISPR-associated protein Cas4 n=1 Tax=Natronomonas sp. EA1 TaxID=3421655 RepID=UPI003EBB9A71